MKTEELKTLKDIECLNKTHDHRTRGDFCIIRKDSLKAEAVNWIKELKKQDKEMNDTQNKISIFHFIDFFGLTEEDLK